MNDGRNLKAEKRKTLYSVDFKQIFLFSTEKSYIFHLHKLPKIRHYFQLYFTPLQIKRQQAFVFQWHDILRFAV